MSGHTARAPSNAQEDDLMQLTLQLRNKHPKQDHAKFHGDDLIGVSTTANGYVLFRLCSD